MRYQLKLRRHFYFLYLGLANRHFLRNTVVLMKITNCLSNVWEVSKLPMTSGTCLRVANCTRGATILVGVWFMPLVNWRFYFFCSFLEPVCKPNQFQCKTTKKCIPRSWMCDNELDCGVTVHSVIDNSDEDGKEC